MGRIFHVYQEPSEQTPTFSSNPTSAINITTTTTTSSRQQNITSLRPNDALMTMHLGFLDLVRGKFEELIQIRRTFSVTDRIYGQITELFARVQENLAADELPYSIAWRRVLRRMDEIIWSNMFTLFYLQQQQQQQQ
ncbi:hypothetical protein BGZ65_005014 [Modicella reniformis]|uniref:Uncharacterized protein n=1 Tax=Modicella reniformis TaxID=1440133 RepID=A0A9P6MHM0_9FUNG|nr:hypothetical protein BGZ65_005014 [Modicella reniformis]